MLSWRNGARLLVSLAIASMVASVLVVAPVLPAHAVRMPKTLAHNMPVARGPVTPGFAIEYLGVIWDGEHGEAAARLRKAGRWGPWIALDEDGAQAEGQYGTQLLDGRRAEAYQVRVPGHARNARAVAINVHDGRAEVIRKEPSPSASAAASTDVVTRAGWGADESLRFKDRTEIWPPAYYDVQKLTVHHTATKNDDPDPAGTVRAIYRYHAVDKGWGDIGYQYLVDAQGVIYEGRWSGTDGDVAHDANGDLVTAAHVGGSNSGNAGVSLLGDFRRTAPRSAAQASLEAVLADLGGRHGIDPQGTGDFVNPVNGAVKQDLPNIPAHSDWESTACPGTKLYDLLPTIRGNVAAMLQPAPAPTTAPAAPTGLAVSGTTSSSVSLTWTDASTDEEAFEIARDGAVVVTLPAGSSSWTDHGVTASTTYSYEVRAVNGAGASGWAGPVSATTAAADEITLSASGTKVKGLQKVDLRWTGASHGDVYWSDNGGNLTLLASGVSSPYRHHVDRKGSGSYAYEVRAAGVVSNRVTVTF